MLQGFTKQINAVENESSDLIIFIPKNRYFAKNKQLAYDSLSHVLNHDNLQQLNIQYIPYITRIIVTTCVSSSGI